MLRLAAVIAALAFPAAASADTNVRGSLGTGPVLAGGAAAWTDSAGVRVGGRVVRRGGGVSVRDGSANRLVLEHEACRTEGRGYRVCDETLLAGPPRGPFARVAFFDDSYEQDCLDQLDLDGTLLAMWECDSELKLRDLAAGTTSTLPFPMPWASSQIQLAGRFVAWVEVARGLQVVVYDRTAGAEAYRTAVRDTQNLRFDLQADGKVAVVWEDDPGRHRLEWYTPSDRAIHALPFTARRPAVRLVGDRIVFDRLLGRGRYALVLTDLSGRARTLARFSRRRARIGVFDFDGARAAWASKRPRRPARIHVRRL